MTIDMRSWHYRFMRFWLDFLVAPPPKTICTYFWTLALVGVITIIIGIAAIVTSPIWVLLVGITWVVYRLGFVGWLVERIDRFSAREPRPRPAWKNRVCPLIDYSYTEEHK